MRTRQDNGVTDMYAPGYVTTPLPRTRREVNLDPWLSVPAGKHLLE